MRKIANQNFFMLGIPTVLILTVGILWYLDGEDFLQVFRDLEPKIPEGEI